MTDLQRKSMMNKDMHKKLKKYFRNIRFLLPFNDRNSRKFLKYLRSSVMEFVQSSDDISFEDIVKRFGTPKDAAFGYVRSLDAGEIYRKTKITAILKLAAALIIISVIALDIYTAWIAYDVHLEQNRYFSEEYTITAN
jgi:hypothetical protein